MGLVLAFVAGWVAGTKAGAKGYAEVMEAVTTLRDSEEFRGFVAIARSTGAQALAELSKLLSGESELADLVDLEEQVQRLTGLRP